MTSPKYFVFGFWVITRHHGGVKVPGLEEIFPTGLPELFQPSRNPKSIEKPQFLIEIKDISVPDMFFNWYIFNFLHPVEESMGACKAEASLAPTKSENGEGKGKRNIVSQYYWDGEIQFYSSYSILTLVKTHRNAGKPYIQNPMYYKSHVIKNPIY